MPLHYQVPMEKKIRVIIDTDAACEADDPFAIAHALMSPKMDVMGICAEHFLEEDSVKRSYEEIRQILEAMDLNVPIYMGNDGPLSTTVKHEISEASSFIIEEALKEDSRPLYVLCLGAITNVAAAITKDERIVSRMTIIWIGGQSFEQPRKEIREYNSGNDIHSANLVLASGVDLWMIPYDVYTTMHIGLAEIERRIYPYGKIGKHLLEQMNTYNHSERAKWTMGESWSLGDSPAVGVALNPSCGRFKEEEAPIILEDTTYSRRSGRPKIRVYKDIDSRYILEDFISKLQLLYKEREIE